MLQKLASHLRALQLYAHHAHNNCKGITFMQDHELFGSIYSAAESDYDDVVERIIGTENKPLDTLAIAGEAVSIASQSSKMPGECNSNYLNGILRLNITICLIIEKCIASKEYLEGTNQLIGNIADKSMTTQYKLKQRLQK